MTTITCVITSFNNEPYIAEAVSSVLQQTRPLDEIIIADDGSTDGSRELLKSLSRDHKNIRLVFRDNNLGVAINRDLAIRDAASTFVTTLDGDDVYYPEKIAKEESLLDGAMNNIAFSKVDWIDNEGNVTHKLAHTSFSGLSKSDKVRYLLFRTGPIPRDMLYSKILFEETGGFNHERTLYEDWDLKLRMIRKADRWFYTAYTGVGYRRHDQGLVHSHDALIHLCQRLSVITDNLEWLSESLESREIYDLLLHTMARSMKCKEIKLIR